MGTGNNSDDGAGLPRTPTAWLKQRLDLEAARPWWNRLGRGQRLRQDHEMAAVLNVLCDHMDRTRRAVDEQNDLVGKFVAGLAIPSEQQPLIRTARSEEAWRG